MAGGRGELEDQAARAWERYDSAVRLGGTWEQRQFALDVAVDADAALAAFDWAQMTAADREMAARALDGA